MPLKTRMFAGTIKSIGLVDLPACEGSEVVVAKRKGAGARTYADTAKMALPDVAKREEVVARLRAAAPAIVAKLEEAATYSELKSTEQARREMSDAIWRLQDSLCSILEAQDVDRSTMAQQSLAEFVADVMAKMPAWLGGSTAKVGRKMAGARWTKFMSLITDLGALAAELAPPTEEEPGMADKKNQFDASKLDEATRSHIASLEADRDAHKARADEAEARAEAVTKKAAESGDDEETILKSMPEGARKLYLAQKARTDAAEKAAADATAIANAEKAARETTQMVEKVRSFGTIPAVDPVAFAPVLKRIRDGQSTAADADEVERVLKAHADLAKTSGAIGRETGVHGGGGATGSAAEEASKRASALVTKGEVKTMAEAYEAVWRADSNLYAQYRQESAQRH